MRKMSSSKDRRNGWGLVLGGVLGLILLSGVGGYTWLDHSLRPLSDVPSFRLVYVPYGYQAYQISELLERKGVIRSARAFRIWAKISRKESHLWAGYYNMSPHFSGQFVGRVLTEYTQYSRLVRLTVPEGYSLRQIAVLLTQNKLGRGEEFVNYVNHEAKLELLPQFPWMAMIPTRNLEGVLYPDTYLFSPLATNQKIVKTLLAGFERNIISQWQSLTPSNNLNFYKTLILASVVEKEAVFREEMPVIAGVFVNRLNANMPLGSDPTVVYALGLDWKATVYYRDLNVSSPYNTYRNRGLPPTPISSPGANAFRAAMNPAKTDYLFFVVSSDQSGRHIFTKTYREHLAVQK